MISELIELYGKEYVSNLDEIKYARGETFVDINLKYSYRNELETVRENLIKNNRYFSNEDFDNNLARFVEDCKNVFAPGNVFYRSRIYNEPDKEYRKKGVLKPKDLIFKGYDAENSFVNTKSEWPTFGRMNPSGIVYLYVSSDYKTSMKEVCPSWDDVVSVSKIINTQELVIADFTKGIKESKDTHLVGLFNGLQEILSEGSSERDYIFPQYVAAFCKSKGFDGIGFKSKYQSRKLLNNNLGINYTIFNYEKCEAVSSELHLVKNVPLTEVIIE